MTSHEYAKLKSKIVTQFRQDLAALDRVYGFAKESEKKSVEVKRKRGRPKKVREIEPDEVEAYVKNHT
jgi:hypothetical protein